MAAGDTEYEDGTDRAFDYAENMMGAATGYLAELRALARRLEDIIISRNDPILFPITDPPTPITTEPPEFIEVDFTLPNLPANFTDTLVIEDFLPEPFDDEPPTMQFGTAPTPSYGTAPDAPAVTFEFEDPELELSLPAPPSLLSVTVVPFDGVTLPTIDYEIPELTAVEPSVTPYVEGEAYTSSLLTTLKETLEDRITNGGTGLNADVENAIWDRGREREAIAAQRAIDELERMESLGYSFPPGAYLNARVKIQTEMAANNRGLSREIMIKQAELELSNVLKALEEARGLESKFIDSWNMTENRALEAAKYATQAGVEIYNAKVRGYAAYVDAYKLKVNVYEAQVRAALTEVEVYKAQIEAELAKTQINTGLVALYKAQADVALANVDIYKARIEGIRTKAEIEKTKVQVFGEQVRAYTAKIGAYTAEVEGYRAGVQAEATKQEAYKARVQAYTAQVEAGTKQIDARIAEFKAKIEAKQLEWDGFKAQVAGESARIQGITQANEALAETYKAEVQGISAYNEALTRQWEATLRQYVELGRYYIEQIRLEIEQFTTVRSLMIEAGKVGAQVTAQLGAAALNAVNFSASLSHSDIHSDTTSTSTSTSHNTNINISA